MNREKLPFEAPYVTTPQMVEVDRAMIEDFKIELIQMMENAGRNLAHLTRIRFLDGDPQGRRVIVLAGGGGNGGGALVAARRLHNWGASVEVILGQPPSAMSEIPAHQLEIVERMDISVMGLCRGKSRSGDRHSRWTDRLWPEGPAARCRGRAYPLGKRAERAHSGA